MTPGDLTADALQFLTERHLATLTTVAATGELHVVPVGFTWLDGVARVITSGDSHKVRNVRATGQAALCQVEGRRWLTLRGRAVVRAEPEEVAAAEALYARRYRTPRVNPRRVVIEIQVEHILARGLSRAAPPS